MDNGMTPIQVLERVIIQLVQTPGEMFFGELAIPFTLPGRMIEDHTCRTAWTDGKRLGFNPEYMMPLSRDYQTYIMAHECLHPGLLHHLRRGNREQGLWNVAGDYEINAILDAAGFKGPPERLYCKEFEGKPIEEIYTILYKVREEQREKKKQQQQQGNESMDDDEDDEDSAKQGGKGNGKGKGKPKKKPDDENDGDDDEKIGPDGDEDEEGDADGTPNDEDWKDTDDLEDSADLDGNIPDLTQLDDDPEADIGGTGQVRDATDPDTGQGLTQEQKEQIEKDYKIAIAQAAQNAKTMGKLPAGIERLVKDILQPELDWKQLLAHWLADNCAKSDYKWLPPNKRMVWQGVYVPSLISDGDQHLVIAIDSSASIDEEMLARASAETCSVLEYWNVILHVVFCDADIQGEPETFTKADYPITLVPRGGGGTDFRPVFNWVAEQESEWKPVGLVYITDLYGMFPETPPEYPVMWLCHEAPGYGYDLRCPFGDIVVMDKANIQ